jgi:phosphatidate cytidylyltransferase
MSKNLIKRVFTSLILLTILLICLFLNKYLWLVLIIIASIISFFEFKNLIKKIPKKKTSIDFINLICFFYLIFFTYAAFDLSRIKEAMFYVLLVCIFTDIGGYIVGKTIGGKKLTKISPNKTISGCVGSFLFSLVPCIFYLLIEIPVSNLYKLVFLTLILSFICQAGDLFISYFKRKAKIKDTGTILPGHGGLLDRIDGIVFAVPGAFILDKIFY